MYERGYVEDLDFEVYGKASSRRCRAILAAKISDPNKVDLGQDTHRATTGGEKPDSLPKLSRHSKRPCGRSACLINLSHPRTVKVFQIKLEPTVAVTNMALGASWHLKSAKDTTPRLLLERDPAVPAKQSTAEYVAEGLILKT